MKKISIKTEVPRHLAFGLVLILSFLLSWYTVTEGKKISKELEDSQIFDVKKRVGGEIIKK
jgi:hypothetical protein